MKKLIGSLVAAFAVFAFASSAMADVVTVTNQDGTVFTMNTAVDSVSEPRAYRDQSHYAHQDDRGFGMIVRVYDSAVNGIGTNGHYVTLGSAIPNNAIIVDSWIQTVTAMSPATNLISLRISNTNDIMQNSTNLGVASLRFGVPKINDLTSQVVVASATNFLTMSVGGGTISTGKFIIFLPYILGQ